jgi:tRNA threonylcarbamoyladenosine biosynthesis protein TsaE
MEIISKSVKDTLDIGKVIAKNLQKGDIICLFGELGSGKTVLTKGIAGGLGIEKSRIVSPSFVLIRQHNSAKLPLYHFDLYRLKDPKDIVTIGYEEYLYDDGISVIEWADRLKYILPKEFLKIELFIKSKKQRLLKFKAFGNRYKELLERIHESRTFLGIQKITKYSNKRKGAG